MSNRAVEVVVEALREQGAKYPNAGASLILDALKASGIAVVDLPEAAYTDEEGAGWNGEPGDGLGDWGVYSAGGRVFDRDDGVTAADAETIASWWLAAALFASATPLETVDE